MPQLRHDAEFGYSARLRQTGSALSSTPQLTRCIWLAVGVSSTIQFAHGGIEPRAQCQQTA